MGVSVDLSYFLPEHQGYCVLLLIAELDLLCSIEDQFQTVGTDVRKWSASLLAGICNYRSHTDNTTRGI